MGRRGQRTSEPRSSSPIDAPRPGSSAAGIRSSTTGSRSARGLRVQVLEQIVRGELDRLVPPLGGAVVAGDQAHAVHCPRAEQEASVLLIEPSGTVNTGDAGGPRT